MPWKFKFTEVFRDELKALPLENQKLLAKSALEQILGLKDPREGEEHIWESGLTCSEANLCFYGAWMMRKKSRPL